MAARADRPGRGCGPLWQVLASLAFALGAVVPLAAKEQFPKAGFAVVDTGIVVSADRSGPIIWMDHDRIIFTALKAGAGPTSEVGAKTREILIYDTRTGKAERYADGALSCFAEGRIGYVIERLVWTDPVTGGARFASRVLHGTMKEETEKRIGTDLFFDSSCTVSSEPSWQVLSRDRHVTMLRTEHGYLDRRRGQDLYNKYVIFVRPGKPPIELPIYGFELGGDTVYAHWADTYVLNADGVGFRPYTVRDPSPKAVIRLLKADGELIELSPPDAFFKYFGHSGPLRLTRAGMVYTGMGNPKTTEQGLYLVNGQQVAQLVDGWVEDLSVSPDGCRLALSSARDFHMVRYPRTIKLVQLCS
jgi:hypothetical protein